jgi:hypothetical protein
VKASMKHRGVFGGAALFGRERGFDPEK